MSDLEQRAETHPPTEPTRKASLLAAEKTLIGVFVFFVALTVFLIAIGTSWYYFTFVLSLVVLLVTYKEGLIAMEDQT